MRFKVRAPASSANLGPGFDTIGLALDLWNELEIDPAGTPGEIRLEGSEAGPLNERENLALSAMATLAAAYGRELPPFALTAWTAVPIARGLGSSAAALVTGLIAADHLLELRLSREELYAVAWRMEGHGDNAGAALYGGAVLAVPLVPQAVVLCPGDVLGLVAVVFIPEMTGATWAAREVLPATIPHADAAFNVATVAGLVAGLLTRDRVLIAAGMHDRLHEPYRARLFPHLLPMVEAARAAGAVGACLSGAGPAVLALVDPADAGAVVAALTATARVFGISGVAVRLEPARRGAHLVSEG